MANFKYKKPQGQRAGCKLCKPWKVNGEDVRRKDNERISDHIRRSAADAELNQFQNTNARQARQTFGKQNG